MRKTLAASTSALILIASLATAAPARADHAHWVLGSGFRVGQFHLNLVFRDFDRQRRPVYYYRVHERFPYRNFPCTSRCFKEGDYYYHDAQCPGVGRHFDAYHSDRHAAFDRYAPRPRYRGDDYRYDDRRYDDRRYDDRRERYGRDDHGRDRRHQGRRPQSHHRPHHEHCPYH